MKEPQQQPISPDEYQVLIVSSHLLIKDKTTNKTLLNKRLS